MGASTFTPPQRGGPVRQTPPTQSRPPERQAVQDDRPGVQLWSAGPLGGCGKLDGSEGIMGVLRSFDLGTWASCLANPNGVVKGAQDVPAAGAPRPRPEGAPQQGSRQFRPASAGNARPPTRPSPQKVGAQH